MLDLRCPCGGVILADTEGWNVPLCHECWIPFTRMDVPKMKKEIERLDAKTIVQEMDLKTQENMIFQLRTELGKAREAFHFIADRENLTFAECTVAEEIVGTASKALRSIDESGVLK